jgi:hypothetical protein
MTGEAMAFAESEHDNDKADAATNARNDDRIAKDRFMVCPFWVGSS